MIVHSPSLSKNLPPALQTQGLTVAIGKHIVVKDFCLELETGVIGCLLGDSGSGKTTVLRAIAGLTPLHSGKIILNGEEVSTPAFVKAPEKRRLGLMFQDLTLFPHLSVAQNIAFGLPRGIPHNESNRQAVAMMLELVGLQGMGQRFAHELSGGQQQRVALARSLAPVPQLLMMDEPFSSLDAGLRGRLARDVRDILKDSGTTALLVTHDQEEAFAMCDQVAVMHQGRLEQCADPYDIYHRPATRKVANFIGEGLWVPGTIQEDGSVATRLGVFRREAEKVSGGVEKWHTGMAVKVLFRPDDVVHDDQSIVTAEVLRKEFRGASFLYRLRLNCGQEFLSLVPSHHNHAIGEWIGVMPASDHLVVFPSETGVNICEDTLSKNCA